MSIYAEIWTRSLLGCYTYRCEVSEITLQVVFFVSLFSMPRPKNSVAIVTEFWRQWDRAEHKRDRIWYRVNTSQEITGADTCTLCGFVCPNKLFVGIYQIGVGWVISGLESMYIDKNPSCSIAELWFICSGRLTIGSQARCLKLWVAWKSVFGRCVASASLFEYSYLHRLCSCYLDLHQ